MFDFYQTYSGYSNAALLAIVSQPNLYQPAAVHAAQQILLERDISEEDRAESATEILRTIEKESRPDVTTTIIRKAGSAITYLFTPSKIFDVRKWNYWLCIGLVAGYGSGWIIRVKFLWLTITHREYTIDWVLFTELFSLLYLVSMLILLLLRRMPGWIMLVALCSYEIIGRIYLFFAVRYFPNRLLSAILVIGIYLLLLRLLAKPRVVIYFKGNYRLFRNAIAAGVIFAALFMVLISLEIS